MIALAGCDPRTTQVSPSASGSVRATASASSGPRPTEVCAALGSATPGLGSAEFKDQVADCSRELTELERVSPKGYACVKTCYGLNNPSALAGCADGCMMNDSAWANHLAQALPPAPSGPSFDDQEKARVTAFVAEPRKELELTLEPLGAAANKPVTVTLSVPQGFAPPEKTAAPVFELRWGKEEFATAPELSLERASGARTADQALESEHTPWQTLKKTEEANGGFELQLASVTQNTVGVLRQVPFADGYITCKATLTGFKSDAVIPYKDTVLPALAGICQSVRQKTL
ncbi:MAG: hypothetical protein U0271_04200 [Polyangiaceae bacterium]